MISLMGPSTTSRESLNTLALILSGPGALFSGNERMTRLTNSQLTGLKLKQSVVDNAGSREEEFKYLSIASWATVSAARLPTDEEYELKSFAIVLSSLE